VPLAQLVQLDDADTPAVEVPAMQLEQLEEPVDDMYIPAEQLVQTVVPVEAAYVPASPVVGCCVGVGHRYRPYVNLQLEQEEALIGAYVPTPQLEQLDMLAV